MSLSRHMGTMPALPCVADSAPPSPPVRERLVGKVKQAVLTELRLQRGIAGPLMLMNFTWFAKTTITTAFLGRLGNLQLAGGALGFTFANVTGYSVLTGICGAMEPICGQAHGAGNRELPRRTLLMATLLLLAVSVPISFLWLNVDAVLVRFGQQREIAVLAKKYLMGLLPSLFVTSFLCPLKAYLSSQGTTLPAMFSSAFALALHVLLNLLLSKSKGLEGVSMAVWLTDLAVVIMLFLYVFVTETNRKIRGEDHRITWWKQSTTDWGLLLRLAAPCCLNTCLEWWCFEILVLLTGRLPDAERAVAVITIVLNFDYLLFSAMLSLATAASVRVSNELGAGSGREARTSAFVSMGAGAVGGLIGAAAMAVAGGRWGLLFSKDEGIVEGARRGMLVMAAVEVVNFPLAVTGGIVRGTALPWLGTWASIGGFYLVALPLAVVMGFRAVLGLTGMLLGFLAGEATSCTLLLVFLARIDWAREAEKAQRLAGNGTDGGHELDVMQSRSRTGCAYDNVLVSVDKKALKNPSSSSFGT